MGERRRISTDIAVAEDRCSVGTLGSWRAEVLAELVDFLQGAVAGGSIVPKNSLSVGVKSSTTSGAGMDDGYVGPYTEVSVSVSRRGRPKWLVKRHKAGTQRYNLRDASFWLRWETDLEPELSIVNRLGCRNLRVEQAMVRGTRRWDVYSDLDWNAVNDLLRQRMRGIDSGSH